MDATAGAPMMLARSADLLSALNVPSIAALVATMSDLALVLDRSGVVRDLAVSETDLPAEIIQGWVGRSLADVVTVESRAKVERLLNVANAREPVIAEAHVNHPRINGSDLPVRYSSTLLGENHVIALGQDLSPIADAQRRLVAAQRASEREYQKLKTAETRFREYFHTVREPSLFVDADDRILAANLAAQATWPRLSRIVGRRASDLVKGSDRDALLQLIAQSRTNQSAASANLGDTRVTVSPLRQERGAALLRFTGANGDATAPQDRVARAVAMMPDGFVVTNTQFEILAANESFRDMIEVGDSRSLVGTSLDRWLGRPGVDLSVIRSALADNGTLRNFATLVRGELGHAQDVEVSAARVNEPDVSYIGLSVRPAAASDAMLPARSAQQLADLVGRVPMKEIVRETTDTIEQMCIEAALELSSDNRASAAELLGLSRQSLYVKMRRYGIVDAEQEPDA